MTNQMQVSAVLQKEIGDIPEYLLETGILESIRSGDPGNYRYLTEVRAVLRAGLDTVRELLVEKHPNSICPATGGLVIYPGGGMTVLVELSSSRVSTSITAKVWGPDKQKMREFCHELRGLIEPHRMDGTTVSFHLAFSGQRGMQIFQVEEIVDEIVHDEAYPDLGGVQKFVRDYLASPESVLILQGPPGTGKTRLMRYLFSQMKFDSGIHASEDYYDEDYPATSRRSPSILYTGDDNLFKSDELFTNFMMRGYNGMLVEDADHLLKPRSDGNRAMRQFLTLADGIVRNPGKKLIFSTNLKSIREIDEALLRPGRCFRWVSTRPLVTAEAEKLLYKIAEQPSKAMDILLKAEHRNKEFSLAEIYKAAATVNVPVPEKKDAAVA